MTKHKSFEAYKYSSQHKFCEAWQQFSNFGSKGHELLEIQKVPHSNTFTLKTTKQAPRWIRWLVRIFYRPEKQALAYVTKLAIDLLKLNAEYIPAAISHVNTLAPLFNKLKGEEGNRLRREFNDLTNANQLVHLISQNILTDAAAQAERILHEGREMEERLLQRAENEEKKIRSQIEAKNQAFHQHVNALSHQYVESEEQRTNFDSIERKGKGLIEAAVREAEKTVEDTIENAESLHNRFLERVKKDLLDIHSNVPQNTAILCKDGKIIETSSLFLRNIPFFKYDVRHDLEPNKEDQQATLVTDIDLKTIGDLAPEVYESAAQVVRQKATTLSEYAINNPTIQHTFSLEDFSEEAVTQFFEILKNFNYLENNHDVIVEQYLSKIPADLSAELYELVNYLNFQPLLNLFDPEVSEKTAREFLLEISQNGMQISPHHDLLMQYFSEHFEQFADEILNCFIGGYLPRENLLEILQGNIPLPEMKIFGILNVYCVKNNLNPVSFIYEGEPGQRLIDCIRLENLPQDFLKSRILPNLDKEEYKEIHLALKNGHDILGQPSRIRGAKQLNNDFPKKIVLHIENYDHVSNLLLHSAKKYYFSESEYIEIYSSGMGVALNIADQKNASISFEGSIRFGKESQIPFVKTPTLMMRNDLDKSMTLQNGLTLELTLTRRSYRY